MVAEMHQRQIPDELRRAADIFLFLGCLTAFFTVAFAPQMLFVHWALSLGCVTSTVSAASFLTHRWLTLGRVPGYWLAVSMCCVPFAGLPCLAYLEMTDPTPISLGSFVLPTASAMLAGWTFRFLLSRAARRWVSKSGSENV
jgi:hypothetical protein